MADLEANKLEANKNVVRRFLAATAAGDADAVDAVQTRDATWWIIGHGTMSREEFTGAVRGMIAAASYRNVIVGPMIAEGDRVAVEIESEMHFGEHIYRNQYHDAFVIRDGLIAEGREYLDTKVVAEFQALMGG